MLIEGDLVKKRSLFARVAILALLCVQLPVGAQSPIPTRVNRTVPHVTPPPLTVAFGDAPTTLELTHARVLPEALLPVGEPTASDNRALARALEAFATADRPHAAAELETFVVEHWMSPWRAAVLVNLGRLRWQEGYFSRAARYWDEAWTLAKDATDPHAHTVADIALGEWLTQATTFGQIEALQARLTEVEARTIPGAAGIKVEAARAGLAFLTQHHDQAMFSGPEALKAILAQQGSRAPRAQEIVAAYRPPHHAGTSLTALRDLATRAGVPLMMRYVAAATVVPVPSIVHLRSQHFSAVVGRRGDGYVLRDPALGGEIVLSAAALEDEASGYLLVPTPVAAAVGRVVVPAEGETVVGHCMPGAPFPDEPCPCQTGAGPRVPGNPTYQLHPLTASVLITATPWVYAPPRGPAVDLTLRYNQRVERLGQPATWGHVGPLWSTGWLSYVTDNFYQLAPPYSTALVELRGGEGEEQYASSSPHWKTHATLVEVAADPVRYERRLPDGTVEVFTLADRAATLYNRRIFLTQVIDPLGQTQTYTYDSQVRLVAVTDAAGQVTTLEYLDSADPLRLTRVTDPFGRAASLTYDAAGRLATITDAGGLTSSFGYAADGFLQTMTTPAGTTTFRKGPDSLGAGQFRRVEATDPLGGTERVEFHVTNTAGLPATAPSAEVPAGYATWNQGLDVYNSLYWSRQAMAEAPGDVSRAVITRWLMEAEIPGAHPLSRAIPHSIKKPLERRVWFKYPGQPNYAVAGTDPQPAEVAQVLEDATTQLTQFTYTAQGMVTSRTDPLGRQTTYSYATNGIDLLEVRQTKPGGSDLLASFSNYTTGHRPQTIVDGAGQTTTVIYNTNSQPLTVTNAKNETTTFTYDTGGTGYLLSVTGPVSGSTTTLTYDADGRPHTVTGPDGYAVTTDSDALNRVTRVTYPDGTTEQATYQQLNLVEERDRLGRATHHFYDAAGRLIATRDPLGRILRQEWCVCGNLLALVDANGHRTSWAYDAEGRVTTETRHDGTTQTTTTHDVTGRLKTVTDPKGQVTTLTYALDDQVLQRVYTNATIATPTVTATYDTVYPRLTTLVDGVGTTAVTYVAPGTLGAGQVASVDGPFPSDTVSYTYDELGRQTASSLSSITRGTAYDALGRVTSLTNPLGTFGITYVAQTGRRDTVTYPNGQTTTYAYFGNTGDNRLQTLHHKNPSGVTLSKFDYTYDPVGNIATWQQQTDTAAPTVYDLAYDAADQLTAGTKRTTDATPTILKRFRYGYDPAGNRTTDQIDDSVVASSYDSFNRLTNQVPGGALRFAGTLSEPATVTIQGKAATVDAANVFRGTAATSSGTNTVTLVARDFSGNQTTKQYQVDVSGSSKTLTYDANGNLTGDGTRTFEWDAQNRLTRVLSGGNEVARFVYDGLDRRVQKMVGSTTTTFIYDGIDVLEERQGGTTTTKYYRGVGIDELVASQGSSGAASYYVADHLGSIIRVTNSAGTPTLTRQYDLWGKLESGSTPAGPAYTGREWDPETGLYYYRARYYDPTLGRFLSEDPAAASANLYGYVSGNVANRIDPSGLVAVPGRYEGLIPIWGSGKAAAHNIECGEWGWAALHTAMAVSDVFLVKSLVVAAGTGMVMVAAHALAEEAGEAAIRTPYALALQEASEAALEARTAVSEGATLYRGGVVGRSAAAASEAQYWALESPLNAGYAARYGIPGENAAFDFIETATLRPGARFITREAPGMGVGASGGGIEAVIEPGGVRVHAFFMP